MLQNMFLSIAAADYFSYRDFHMNYQSILKCICMSKRHLILVLLVLDFYASMEILGILSVHLQSRI